MIELPAILAMSIAVGVCGLSMTWYRAWRHKQRVRLFRTRLAKALEGWPS